MSALAVGCGGVPWERELLATAAAMGVAVQRRHVDMASVTREADAGWHGVVLLAPALRGYAERPLRALVTRGCRVVTIVDDIRPPWLLAGGFDVREREGLDWGELLESLLQSEPTDSQQEEPRGTVTTFLGVGGGVGCSTLAAAHASAGQRRLLVDADANGPSLAFLLNVERAVGGFDAGPRHGLLAPSVDDLESLGGDDVAGMVRTAARDFSEVVVDAGSVMSPWADGMAACADRVVLVAAATPVGLVRLCGAARHATAAREVAVIVNRVRDSAVGGRGAARAIRALVERELGLVPHLVADRADVCDSAWLQASPMGLAGLLPSLTFAPV